MLSHVRNRKRTWDVPGGLYFVTCVTRERKPLFGDPANIALLSSTLHRVLELHPFRMIAYAYMPDHLHLLIQLAEVTHNSQVMHSLKRNYTLNHKRKHGITVATSLWQPSFREHLITDDNDLAKHIDYIHYNPIKHGLAKEYGAYPHTSYSAYQRCGQPGPTANTP